MAVTFFKRTHFSLRNNSLGLGSLSVLSDARHRRNLFIGTRYLVVFVCWSERTGVLGTVPVSSVPVWMSYRTYQIARYRYWCRTELTEVSGTGIDMPIFSGTGMKVCTGTGGTGVHIVPKLSKCPVPVLLLYRTTRSVRYRYWCRTELTEVSDTGIIDFVPNLPKCPLPVLMSYRTYRSVRYR